ncbi:mitochondrial carrier protein, putative [Plasmodium vinckei vinckei]|uniref:Mitochondrial carrier protein, putative n=1 Tax=Plasmodium vinckei vinckei TaxID=54757 RepID=A0A449BVR0_PLAVN|nr:mitochondrial carrier protein, putative [Plasmodium vinckei vinckei]VEV57570.1 mitochondrial carrier protein, putative [Plasmodium vinckei vinckei]
MDIKVKNGEEKKSNKNTVLLCGLVSGVLTKTIFAPFDRIKLFYQIQPMFHYNNTTIHKNKRKDHLKRKNESINKNILLNSLNKVQNKQDKTNNPLIIKSNKYIKNTNVVFHNFLNCLNEINRNCQKKRKISKTNISNSTINKYYSYSNKSSHTVFKNILFHYKIQHISPLNNLCKNYTILNINKNVANTIKNKMLFLSANANKPIKYQSIIQSVLFIVKEEGILGLWKGNLINTLRGGVVYSAKFGTNDIIKEKYKTKKRDENMAKEAQGKHLPTASSNNNSGFDKNKINYYESVIAGYTSGIIQKTLSYPLDLLSIRAALGVNEKYLRQQKTTSTKKSIFKIIREIHVNEGFAGFFKGYVPTLLTGVPYVTLQMVFFDLYKNNFQNNFQKNSSSLGSVALYSSIAGSLSNVTSLIIVFPGDTVRKRMMNNGIDNNYIYKNTFHCIKKIYYHEGLKSFYSGLFPSILKCVPSGAIQFMSYEILKYFVSQN